MPLYNETFRKKNLLFEGMLVPFPALGGDFCIPCIMGNDPSRSCNTRASIHKQAIGMFHGPVTATLNASMLNARATKTAGLHWHAYPQ